MWLAGTGDGRLFGVATGALNGPYGVYAIDPASGAETTIGSLPLQGPTAFAHGQLYVFTPAPGGARGTTDLYTFDPASGTSSKRAHFDVRMGGAGASTCSTR